MARSHVEVALKHPIKLIANALGSPPKDVIDQSVAIGPDWAVIVQAGTWHNVINSGLGPLRLYTIYTPAEHADGTVHRTKADADADSHHH